MEGYVKKVGFEHLAEIIPFAKADNITHLPECEFLAYYIKDKLIATVGWTTHKNKFVLRNDFVLKEYRGQGIYEKLHKMRVNLLQPLGKKVLEIRCTPMSYRLHKRLGAVPIKRYKNSIHLNYYL